MIGTVLNVKPVLQIQGGRLDAYAKVRGPKQARRTMLEAIEKDLQTRFNDAAKRKEIHLFVAHTAEKPMPGCLPRKLPIRFPILVRSSSTRFP